MKANRRVAAVLMLAGGWFAIVETDYFGNNLFPGSPFELVCDLFSLSVVICGCVLLYHNQQR